MSTSRKEYIEVELPISGFDTDLLSGTAYANGALGILESSEALWTIYLPGDIQAESIREFFGKLSSINPDFESNNLSVEKRPYQDWDAEWRQYFEPLQVLPGLWVRPPWENAVSAAAQEIIIDPQMAFGTGGHESTRLMIQSMSRIGFQGKKVLDLGCGSGILAIYAHIRRARTVLGVDIEEESIENSIHNAGLNKVDGIEFSLGDIDCVEEGGFDIILANINFNALLAIPDKLRMKLSLCGELLISGILTTNLPELRNTYESHGLNVKEITEMGEWSAILWGKNE